MGSTLGLVVIVSNGFSIGFAKDNSSKVIDGLGFGESGLGFGESGLGFGKSGLGFGEESFTK
jgi:hypothetical protein